MHRAVDYVIHMSDCIQKSCNYLPEIKEERDVSSRNILIHMYLKAGPKSRTAPVVENVILQENILCDFYSQFTCAIKIQYLARL